MKISLFLMVFIITTFLFSSPVSAWLDNYDYRMPIEINNTGNNLTNYQYNFTIDTASLVSVGKMNINGSDCRITNSTDVLQEFWNETTFNESDTKIWVNATELGNITNTTHYIYYGKSDAIDITNISSTFDFGDSFSIDTLERISESTNPTRTADQAWEGGILCEQSDFHYGGEYISWYRGHGSGTYETGFENSTDGITWTPYSANPIINHPTVYNYVVQDGDCFYLFVNTDASANGNGDMYLYNVTDYTNPVIMNGGNAVYTRSSTPTDWDYKIFNPGIAIDSGGRWHMLLEGQTSTSSFHIGYAYSNLTEMNWSLHRSSSYVIAQPAGNPDLVYVPDRNALLSLRSAKPGSVWEIVASYANLSTDLTSAANWSTSTNFKIAASGIHIADGCLMSNFNTTYPIMISYNYNQAQTYQCYYAATLNEFYDGIMTNVLDDNWNTYGTFTYGINNGILTVSTTGNAEGVFVGKTSVSMPHIVESRAKALDVSDRARFGFSAESSSAVTTLVQWWWAHGTGNPYVASYTGSTGGYTQLSEALNHVNYHTYQIKWLSGSLVKFYYDDTYKISRTSNIPTTDLPAWMLSGTDADGDILWDWIFIRQYAAVEPVSSLDIEEYALNEYIPPNPTNLQNITGVFWINHTWQTGAGNVTDSYNISVNNVWHNETINTYWNVIYGYGNDSWQNITIWAYNNTEIGSLSTDSISQNTQLLFTNLPTNLQKTYNNFWVNWTWDESFIGTHIIDSHNVSINDTWYNSTTNQFYNHAGLDYELISSIIVHGYNNTQGLSIYCISGNYTFSKENKMVDAIEQLVTPIQIIADKFFKIIPFIISIILFAGFGLTIMVMTSRLKKW